MIGDMIERVQIPSMVHPNRDDALLKMVEHYRAKCEMHQSALLLLLEALHPRRDEYLYDIVSRAYDKGRPGYHDTHADEVNS